MDTFHATGGYKCPSEPIKSFKPRFVPTPAWCEFPTYVASLQRAYSPRKNRKEVQLLFFCPISSKVQLSSRYKFRWGGKRTGMALRNGMVRQIFSLYSTFGEWNYFPEIESICAFQHVAQVINGRMGTGGTLALTQSLYPSKRQPLYPSNAPCIQVLVPCIQARTGPCIQVRTNPVSKEETVPVLGTTSHIKGKHRHRRNVTSHHSFSLLGQF